MSTITMENLGFVLRAGLALNRARALTEKAFFRKEEWTRSDYLEAAGDVGYLILESISGSKKWEARHLETTSSSKEERQNAESLSRIVGLLAGCSSFSGDFTAGKSFRKALFRSTLLGRIVVFIDRPLSFATSSMPVVQRSSELVIKTTETVVYARDMVIVMKQWQIFSNLLYIDAMNDIRNHNEKALQQVPLTIPPKGKYTSLPEEHEKDFVFSKYRCGIHFKIIRYPVCFQDGKRTRYYELSAISEWVQKSGTNPATRAEISIDDISIDLTAQREIEDRMRALGIPLNSL